MKGILLVGKFTDKFREINKKLVEKYEVRACVTQMKTVEGMIQRKEPDLIAVISDESDSEVGTVFKSIKDTYPSLPVVGIDASLSMEMLDKKIEAAINGEIEEEKPEEPVVKVEDEVLTEVANALPEKIWEKGEKKRVLMVDDSGVFLRLLKSMIEDHYDVRMTTSGLNVHAIILDYKPDVILLDYDMPMFDGKQTMEKIRESEEIKDIPIVFVTAVNKREHILEVLRQKPAGYILKPVEKDRILQTLRDVVGE